jgi:putative DNA primase/helicase
MIDFETFSQNPTVQETALEIGVSVESLYQQNFPTNVDDTGESKNFNNPEQAQIIIINKLLKNVQFVNLVSVCESLGWLKSQDDKPPAQKYILVAIIKTLLQIAKTNHWHIIHNAGFFYIYNGAYWVALEDDLVKKRLLKEAAIKMGYSEIECRTYAFVDRLFQQAQADGFFIERNYQKQSIINLRNGSLVLSDKGVALKPFDHTDFLTHQLDFNYDREAYNPVFARYLTKVLPDENTRQTLQQVLGYLFIKGLKMERVFFLFGLGANGKSVIFEVLNGLLGAENMSNYSLESLTDEKGYHRAMIKNKIVNFGTDIKLNKVDAANFKTLASGEPIEARLPHKDPFMMADYAKLIFNVNKMDSASIEHTQGFYRRLLIIPFMQTIPHHEQDRDLHKKILVDKAGVLNWIIDGAKKVIKNRDIFVSQECEDFKGQFIKETDSVAMFEEETIKQHQPAYAIYDQTVTQAFLDYKQYCTDSGYKPLGRNNFSKRMESLGFEKSKLETGWYLVKKYF